MNNKSKKAMRTIGFLLLLFMFQSVFCGSNVSFAQGSVPGEVQDSDDVSGGISPMKYNAAAEEAIQQSSDINKFKKFLNREVVSFNEKGEETTIPIYELYRYDINDVSTWKGISFDREGNITDINLPLFGVDGKLDLSGFSHLNELVVMYTDLDEIDLSGCTELTDLTVAYNPNLTEIDLGDCNKLKEADLTANALTSIIWENCEKLKYVKCQYNYLDVYTLSMQKIAEVVKKNNGQITYQKQRAIESLPYCEQEIAVIQSFLASGNNASVLGWNSEDISSWTGVEWKTVSGQNHIDRIDVSEHDVSGTLDVTGITYLRELVCLGTKLTAIDVSGLKYLVQLTCLYSELEQLTFSENDDLLYLDCQYNYLDIEDIMNVCKEFELREGAQIYYEEQYIGAGREAFNAAECEALEAFAKTQDKINWNMDKPGRIPGITWAIKDGEYRAEKIDLSIYNINLSGSIDLSVFEKLEQINLSKTRITKVTLPKTLKEISERSFYACFDLEEIEIPESVNTICTEAFANCASLRKVIFLGDCPQNLGADLFTNTAEDFTVSYYASKKGWESVDWKEYKLVKIDSFPAGSAQPEQPSAIPSSVPTTMPSPSQLPGSSPAVGIGKPSQTPVPEKTAQPVQPANGQAGKQNKAANIKILKINISKKSVSVVIQKNKKVNGYVLAYRRGKNGKFKTIVVTNWKKSKFVLKKLKKGDQYSVKVRSYIVVNGKKYFSSYSKLKTFRFVK